MPRFALQANGSLFSGCHGWGWEGCDTVFVTAKRANSSKT